ncbi:MAG: hydrogenase iron-sulfur subunit [Deltaproteobacteria bacterium]|nr:hydrogenase iron-sulfur subunit [Deltaproteobacteria bacterium]
MQEYKPKLICFSCKFGWGYLTDNPTLKAQVENLIPVTCTGKVDTVHLLNAFKNGADGVMLLGCPEGHCHFQDGNYRAAKRIYLLHQVLRSFGLEPERVGIYLSSDPDGRKIPQFFHEMESNLIRASQVTLGGRCDHA